MLLSAGGLVLISLALISTLALPGAGRGRAGEALASAVGSPTATGSAEALVVLDAVFPVLPATATPRIITWAQPEPAPPAALLPSVASVGDAPTALGPAGFDRPTRLVIPFLGVDAPIEPVGVRRTFVDGQGVMQWVVPNGYVVGWHASSAPLGVAGNTVLNGHNNIYGEVFRDLIDLPVGKEFTVFAGEEPRRYVVDEHKLFPESDQRLAVRLANARWIEATGDERVTLVSCYPYSTNRNRIVVVGRPMSVSDS
ncbi:MAG: sortase [Candidatus Promineifilaceae bacterium]